jgi:hypothetical protein
MTPKDLHITTMTGESSNNCTLIAIVKEYERHIHRFRRKTRSTDAFKVAVHFMSAFDANASPFNSSFSSKHYYRAAFGVQVTGKRKKVVSLL